MLLSLKKIHREYNDKVILNDINFNIQDNDKIALIGVNGTGKSTLLKVLAEYKELDSNQAMVKNGMSLAYLPQDTYRFETDDILDYVCDGAKNDSVTFEAKKILNKLDINGFDKKISTLSGDQKKRVALARVLLRPVDLLLLDEPTNHLDANMIEWLEQYLIRINCAIVMITHDRYFLERIVNKIVELDQGEIYEYEGNYSKYLELKTQRLESDKATRRKQLALLKGEHTWIMQGPKARSTKSKDRIERYEQLKDDVKETKQSDLKLDSVTSRLGKKILEITDLSVGYPDKVLINDFNYTFKRNEHIGLVGINGSGKTTLLNVLAERIEPIKGVLDYGSTIKIGYFSQHSDDLSDEQRVIDYIKDKAEFIETNTGKVSASIMLEQFLFQSEQQYSLISKLSGGEKRRLLLLGVLMKAPNFLILDEPTNDLDITTLTILEDYLLNFEGVIVIVSHDRFFMDKIVDILWVIKNQSITVSNDDYTSYLSENKEIPKKIELVKKEYVKEKKLRLSYQEQKELKTIDNEITTLTEKLAGINQEMNDCGTDFQKLQEIQKRQDEVTKQLEKKELRWLELQEKVELVENN